MTNEQIFEIIKDQFNGVKMLPGSDILLLAKDGQSFQVNQAQWDKEYEIRFHCSSTASCDDCSDRESERWQVLKKHN